MAAILSPRWGGLDASESASQIPRPCDAVFFLMRTQFGKQLYARGIARHAPTTSRERAAATSMLLPPSWENAHSS